MNLNLFNETIYDPNKINIISGTKFEIVFNIFGESKNCEYKWELYSNNKKTVISRYGKVRNKKVVIKLEPEDTSYLYGIFEQKITFSILNNPSRRSFIEIIPTIYKNRLT